MRGKHYRTIKEKAPANPINLDEAILFIKSHARPKFDETIELHVRLGVDSSKSEQMVRGQVVLPSGTVKKPRLAVFAAGEKERQAALEAGAVIAGGDELIKQITAEGKLDADLSIATPEMMPKIARVAKILGPKGLMPNPKTGTVTPDPVQAVTSLMSGKVSFKMDQLGNLHLAIGKMSWPAEAISANVGATLEALKQLRPAAAKGEFIQSVTLSSTMGPGIKIAV